MSTTSIPFVLVLSAMLSLGCAFSAYYPMALCKATVIDHEVQSTLAECMVPSYFSGFNSGGSGYVDSRVTKPAELDGVDVNWFLSTDGCPAINVTVRATSQGSEQDYRINLLADVTPTPLFCGRILTKKLPGDNQNKQTFGVEIRCPPGILKQSVKIFVPVQVKGKQPVVTEYTLPPCKDPIMAQSNKCREEEKERIRFSLKQERNSTVVILDTKSAYPMAQTTSDVYVMIQERTDNEVSMWRTIQPPVQLFWPKRTTRFRNLSMGQTYQVLVWRPWELTRYSQRITMREDQKRENTYFLRTIEKRRAIRAQLAREQANNE